MSVWEVLGMRASGDVRDIKRAYARQLKVTRPEDDPAGFQTLRDAYEMALQMAAQAAAEETEPSLIDVDEQDRPAPATHAQAVMPAVPDLPSTPDMQAASAGPDPMQQARQLWDEYLAKAAAQPKHRLAKMSGSDALLNLQVRECFEWCAAQYCAGDECPSSMREAIVQFYGWDNDAAFIARHAPEVAQQMLSRFYADQSYAYFSSMAPGDAAVHAILSDKIGSTLLYTCDAKFTRSMRALIHSIRWSHADLLHHKLDHAVFEHWERAVASKQYFFQTALHSVLIGFLLWLPSLGGLAYFNALDEYDGTAFLASELLSFAGMAWLAFRPPLATRDWIAATWQFYGAQLWHHHRFTPPWQFWWTVPFALASLCLFIPAPSPLLRIAVGSTLVACFVVASFANSVALNGMGYFLSAAIAIGFGLHVSSDVLPGYDFVTFAAAIACTFQLFYRGGADLYDWLGLGQRWIMPARVVWLAGGAAIICGAGAAFGSDLSYAALAFLWTLLGLVLMRPSVAHFIPVFCALFARSVLTSGLSIPVLKGGTPLAAIVLLMLVISIFMVVNMVRAQEHQHQFA